MAESEQRSPRSKTSSRSAQLGTEDLPFRIELVDDETGEPERVLARVQSSSLARVIFEAACSEYPGRHLILKRGARALTKRRG